MEEEVKILNAIGFQRASSHVINYCRERLPWYLQPIFVMEVVPDNLHIIFERVDINGPNKYIDLYLMDFPEKIWEHYVPKNISEIIQDLQEE